MSDARPGVSAFENHPAGERVEGEAVREHVARIFRNSPDLAFRARHIYVRDGLVVNEWTAIGDARCGGRSSGTAIDVLPDRDGLIDRKAPDGSSSPAAITAPMPPARGLRRNPRLRAPTRDRRSLRRPCEDATARDGVEQRLHEPGLHVDACRARAISDSATSVITASTRFAPAPSGYSALPAARQLGVAAADRDEARSFRADRWRLGGARFEPVNADVCSVRDSTSKEPPASRLLADSATPCARRRGDADRGMSAALLEE